ncbi:MAG: hypothetical protein AAGF92_14620 [Myxococcota bacterium]
MSEPSVEELQAEVRRLREMYITAVFEAELRLWLRFDSEQRRDAMVLLKHAIGEPQIEDDDTVTALYEGDRLNAYAIVSKLLDSRPWLKDDTRRLTGRTASHAE